MFFLLNQFFIVIGNVFQSINISVNYVSFNILGNVLSELGGFDIIVHVYICWDPSETKLFWIHHRRTISWSINLNLFAFIDHVFHRDRILWDSVVFNDVHSLFECMIGYAPSRRRFYQICGRCMTLILENTHRFPSLGSWFAFGDSFGRRLNFSRKQVLFQMILLVCLRCRRYGFLLLRNLFFHSIVSDFSWDDLPLIRHLEIVCVRGLSRWIKNVYIAITLILIVRFLVNFIWIECISKIYKIIPLSIGFTRHHARLDIATTTQILRRMWIVKPRAIFRWGYDFWVANLVRFLSVPHFLLMVGELVSSYVGG